MSKKSSNLKLEIRDQQQIVANAVVRNIDVLKVDASAIALENFILLQNHAKYEAIVFKNKINKIVWKPETLLAGLQARIS